MGDRTPIMIKNASDTATVTGKYRVYWLSVYAATDTVLTITDDSDAVMIVGVAAKDTKFILFQPGLVFSTSVKVTKTSGTCDYTYAYAPA